jgi:phosphoglycerate-specific signal transduction histidine kinase
MPRYKQIFFVRTNPHTHFRSFSLFLLTVNTMAHARTRTRTQENDIDGEVLLSLDEPELRECLGVADSDVRCLLDAIAALLSSPTAAAAQ